MTAPRTCRCGKQLSGKYVTQCGTCGRKRFAQARADRHDYKRIHIHVWADGSRTVEMGIECGEGCA